MKDEVAGGDAAERVEELSRELERAIELYEALMKKAAPLVVGPMGKEPATAETMTTGKETEMESKIESELLFEKYEPSTKFICAGRNFVVQPPLQRESLLKHSARETVATIRSQSGEVSSAVEDTQQVEEKEVNLYQLFKRKVKRRLEVEKGDYSGNPETLVTGGARVEAAGDDDDSAATNSQESILLEERRQQIERIIKASFKQESERFDQECRKLESFEAELRSYIRDRIIQLKSLTNLELSSEQEMLLESSSV